METSMETRNASEAAVPTPVTSTGQAGGIVDAAWRALRAHLAARCRELDGEVAHYPTPISRCDVQLTKLLEQRGRVWRQATLADEAFAAGAVMAGGVADGIWLQRSEDAAEDDAENALRAALRVALRIGGRMPHVDEVALG
jgi:hypothetical protein